MYNSVKAAVISNNETSPFFDSNKGVKQENPVSFFYYFVNDILTNCNANIEGLFTQDDLKVFICYLLTMQFFLLILQKRCNLYLMINNTTVLLGN